MYRKIISLLSTLLIVTGLIIPGIPAFAAAPTFDGNWSISSSEPQYVGEGSSAKTKITYTVTKTGNVQDLSHFTIPICDRSWKVTGLTFSTKDGSLETHLGVQVRPVLKYNSGKSHTFTVTATFSGGHWDTTTTTAYIKTGSQSGWFTSSVTVPSCDPIEEEEPEREKLQLTGLCTDSDTQLEWRVTNPNTSGGAISFTYMDGSTQVTKSVAAGSSVEFSTARDGVSSLTIYVDGVSEDSASANTSACSTTPPPEPQKLVLTGLCTDSDTLLEWQVTNPNSSGDAIIFTYMDGSTEVTKSVSADSSVKFTTPRDGVSSLTIYVGEVSEDSADANTSACSTTPSEREKLELTGLCTDSDTQLYWKVTNPNSSGDAISFTYMDGSTEVTKSVAPGAFVEFNTARDGVSSLTIYVGEVSEDSAAANTSACSTTPSERQKLVLTGLCTDSDTLLRWQVTNPNSSGDISFTYMDGETGSVDAGETVIFTTPRDGVSSLTIYVDGVSEDSASANTNACTPPEPQKLVLTGLCTDSDTVLNWQVTNPNTSGDPISFTYMDGETGSVGAGATVTFTTPRDEVSSLTIYVDGVSEDSADANTTACSEPEEELELLTLSGICVDRAADYTRWRVRNPNSEEISFLYTDGENTGTEKVKANSSVTFRTQTDRTRTLGVYVGEVLQDTATTNTTSCNPPTPPPPPPVEQTGSVTVRVFDNSERNNGNLEPIRNASVQLSGGLSGTTNGSGQVVFTNLSFGSYSATGSSPDPTTGTDVKSGNGSTTITTQEPNGTITILLNWAPALTGSTPPAPTPEPEPKPEPTPVPELGKITVRVFDGSPRNQGSFPPIPGASINLGTLSGTTNAKGEIVFDKLTFAQYKATAEAVDPKNPTLGEKKSGSGMATITPQSPEETITIILAWDEPLAAPAEQPVVIAAVAMSSITGRICAPRDPGAELVATDEAGQTVKTFVAATGRLGVWMDYTLENLSAGKWTITLSSPGDAPVTQTVTVNSGEVVNASDFSLACTGQNSTPFPVGAFYLSGALMVAAGLFLRRFAKVA